MYYYAIYIDDDEQPPVFIKVTISKDDMLSFLHSQFNIENEGWVNNIYHLKDDVILKTVFTFINQYNVNIVYSSPIKPQIVILSNDDGDLIDIINKIK